MFPEYIDNSMRRAFIECPTRFSNRYVANLAPVEPNVHLHFGGAFAAGIEAARRAYFERGIESTAELKIIALNAGESFYGNFITPVDSYKSKQRLGGAMEFYLDTWPLGSDGLRPYKNGIEWQFTLPLEVNHPDTGKPLVFVGRTDLLAEDKQTGALYVVDEKTASRLGDTWDRQWDMNGQITAYCVAVQRTLGTTTIPMGLVRGISILKAYYGHAEIPLVRTQWMLDRFWQQLQMDVQRMVNSYNGQRWDMNLDNACSSYGRSCEYQPLCRSANPERLVEGNFKIEVWNPIRSKE